MDTVANITTAASKAIWGDTEEDAAQKETAGKEPVSGQLGNVAAGEPYDKGNLETPKSETPSTLGAAVTKAANDTSAEHDRAATNGRSSLYNPILPATPGDNVATDYTASARRASAISADSQNGEPMSPTLQNVVESDKVSDAATAQKNGVQRKEITTLDNKEDATKPSTAGIAVGSGGQKRQTARRGSSAKSIDRGELAFRSVSREAERKAAERSALSPLHKTESERRRSAQATAANGVGYNDEAGFADSSVLKARKPSLKDKIKAKFGKH